MIPARRRTGAAFVATAITLATLSGCTAAGDVSAVDGEAQAPTTDTEGTTRTALEDLGTTVPVDETTTSTSTAASTATSTATSGAGEPAGVCNVEPVPASAGLDPFYTEGCEVHGFRVVANEAVDPEAVVRAADTVERILAADEQLAATLAGTGIRLGIIGRNQRTTEMPEYRDLNEAFPETDWDSRARGLGATLERPLVSAGEENVLCLPEDRYFGEDILLHEFSHVLHEFGYSTLDPDFDAELLAAYQKALGEGTWVDTYATTNHHEYWAEGVQSYFGRNLTADPADGVHGPIDTRAELEVADPALYALIDQRLGSVELPPQCD